MIGRGAVIAGKYAISYVTSATVCKCVTKGRCCKAKNNFMELSAFKI